MDFKRRRRVAESLSLIQLYFHIDEYLKEGNNPDAPGHFIPWLIGKNDVYAYVFDAVRIDIGTPESYYDACEKQRKGTLFNN